MRLRPSTFLQWALSLQGRLLIGLVATWALVTLLLMGVGWHSGRALVQESNLTHLRYEADLIADALTRKVEARLDALTRLASRLESRADETGVLRDQLRHSDALLEWFDSLVVADASGVVQADWPVLAGRKGLDIEDRDYFRFVRAFRRPHVSEPLMGRVTGTPLVMFVVPRLGEAGEFLGFVGGLVEVHEGGIFSRLQRLRLGEAGFAAIVTASGKILYHPDQRQVMTPIPDDDVNPWVNLARDGWEGEAEGELPGVGMAYQAYRQIWPADWLVGVVLPKPQVMTPLRALFQRLGWSGLAIAGLLLPLMGWLVWRALRPLYRLEAQIMEVGEGRRSTVALPTRMQELRQVADAFNRVERERGRALSGLRDRQAFLNAVLASSPVGMFVTDTRGAITYMNPALVELTGRPSAPRQMADWVSQLHPDDRSSARDLWQYSLASGEDFLQQCRYLRPGGEPLWLEVHASRVTVEAQELGFVGTVKDITRRREEEALRQWEAEHDPLTGLLNRRGFERRLEEAMADWRMTGMPSALILCDLDHFKPINDQGGHALGDEMLRLIARSMHQVTRGSDHVARQGGDEFAVLLPSCTPTQALRVAEALRDAVSRLAVTHHGREYRVTLSVGVTTFEAEDQRIETVIERADIASYRAKRMGRNRVIALSA